MVPRDGEGGPDPLTLPPKGRGLPGWQLPRGAWSGTPWPPSRPSPVAEASPTPRIELERGLEWLLARGRRLVTLTWAVALLQAILGLVTLRQAALLVDLDHDLVTKPSVEAFGDAFGFVRVLLAVAFVALVALAVHWVRRAVPLMERLAALDDGEQGRLGRVGGAGSVGSRTVATTHAGRRDLPRLAILLRPAGVPPDRVSWAEVRVGSGRRLAIATVVVTVAAAVIGLAAAVGLLGAADLEIARAWRSAAGVDAGLWILASILAGGLVADVAWRAAVAARAVGIFAPLSDAPGRLAVRIVPAALLFGGLVPIAVFGVPPGSAECAQSTLRCGAVVVPVDHRGGPRQETIPIVYGIHPATGERRGTLMVAVGGPGASGLRSADSMIEGFDDEIVRRYDIVFWDQRGIGESDGHDCPVAGGIYSGVETTGESARLFVTACLNEAETGRTGLWRYATAQAAEDLEAIREQLGVERFVLYGESYGTELAQVYAAAHPDRLTALILDGAVDLTLSANEFWSTAALGFDSVLESTIDACRGDQSCSADAGDPEAAYDRFLRRVSATGVTVTYADADGLARDHHVGRSALESAVGSLLYEPAGRGLLMRAIAALDGGDYVPIARLAGLFGTGIGPVSAFAYHAILCADYRVSPTADPTDVAAVLANGRRSGALQARTDEVYLAQLPCLYWPDQPAATSRPEPLTDLPAPLIVLGATTDPITPISMGRAIVERAANSYLVETRGGPHVTFGRGYPCVDRVIRVFLLEDRLPGRVTHCSSRVASPYIPLSPLVASDFEDAMDAMTSLENEIDADPLYTYWNLPGQFSIGCRYRGHIDIAVADDGDAFTFADCEFARGMAVTGSGGYDPGRDEVTLDVSFAGGRLRYTSGAAKKVSGVFRNQTVDIRR